jgi:hypothetical protein
LLQDWRKLVQRRGKEGDTGSVAGGEDGRFRKEK